MSTNAKSAAPRRKATRTRRTQPKADRPAYARSTPPIGGRDAALPDWLISGRPVAERPRFDSAVIIGNGINALSVAARLARSQSFAGRVVLVGKPVEQQRRLIGGLTLRARALDYFAACLGVPRSLILDRLFGGRHAEAASYAQKVARFERRENGSYALGRMGEWMSRWHHQGRVLAYGVRNSHLAGVLHDLMAGLDYRWEDAKPVSMTDCLDLAPGDNPIVINAKPAPLLGVGRTGPKPTQYVVAAQVPFANPRQAENGLLPYNNSLFCARRRRGRLDASVWYPMIDPLSPSARYYSVFYRVVRAGSDLHKNAEIETLKNHLFGIGDILGFEPVDPEATMGSAMVPCSPTRPDREVTPNYLHLGKVHGSGTPIIAGDGMARAGLTGYVTAEAILAGVEPRAYLYHAHRGWARRNRLAHHMFNGLSWITDPALRWSPGRALNLIQDYGETWAGLETD
ncbi:hypothetical protein PC39_14107 [Salinisphaera sp. PC39]|uniref:hypothetical protein n=1 Tax=Salinisphaera sp. PC39 TaxID=1304156 RepID=UPI00333E71FD